MCIQVTWPSTHFYKDLLRPSPCGLSEGKLASNRSNETSPPLNLPKRPPLLVVCQFTLLDLGQRTDFSGIASQVVMLVKGVVAQSLEEVLGGPCVGPPSHGSGCSATSPHNLLHGHIFPRSYTTIPTNLKVTFRHLHQSSTAFCRRIGVEPPKVGDAWFD